MKPVKTLGLTALAALMAMAFVGASSAMAFEDTQLCKVDQSPCEAKNVITHIHEETLAGAPDRLLSSIGDFTCQTILFLGDTLGLATAPASLVIHGHFFFYNCQRELSEDCAISEVSTDSLIRLLKTGHETALVTYSFELNVFCNIFTNCTFFGAGLKGTAKGALLSSFTNGDVTLNEQTLEKISGLCPKTAKLDISTMPLEKVYISS